MIFRSISPFILIILILFSCGSPKANSAAIQKAKKYAIDSSINAQRNLLVLVKIKGRKQIAPLSRQTNSEVEVVYNIFKDQQGRIVYISEMPKSHEENWFIAYKSYFDENGNLFAFQRQNNFFQNECAKGAALENLVKYYDAKVELIDSSYTLTDSYKKTLNKSDCKFPYNFPYSIDKSLHDYQNRVKGL